MIKMKYTEHIKGNSKFTTGEIKVVIGTETFKQTFTYFTVDKENQVIAFKQALNNLALVISRSK